MDFGYPQTTESKILQEWVAFTFTMRCCAFFIIRTGMLTAWMAADRYITQESHKLEIQARPPIAVTNAVSWRSEGIRYRKNEVFLDVIESLNLLVSSTGNVLRSEILGAVKLKCYLSGMPELRLGLNDKVMFETTGRATGGKAVEMEDVKFHQCVRLSRFENDRTISFIPPDGEFELMSYRLNTQVKPLIWVESDVRSHSGSRIEFTLKVSLISVRQVAGFGWMRPNAEDRRQERSSNVGQQRTTLRSPSPSRKTQIPHAFGRTSGLCTTRPKSQPSSGR